MPSTKKPGVFAFAVRHATEFFAIAILLAVTNPAIGQLSTATLTGVVRDSSGAVVPNAQVVLKNVQTNVERRSVSNSTGSYTFLNVTPGRYTLETTAQGFRPNRVAEFDLSVNQTMTQDTTLEVGALEQAVEVQASAEALQSSTAELGSVMATKQVVDLPLNGRNFTALLQLTPGASPISVSQNSGAGTFGTPTTYGADYEFPAMNGQTNRSNFFRTDGLNNQGSFLSTYAVPPIIDTIQEFKVNSHNDQAEFGSVLGGVINVVTKSGTNDLHGSAWEYVRNDAFDARNTFQQSVQTFRQNQFGFALGGPVMIPKLYNGKNKTFFYGGLQEFRYRSPANSFFRVPTAANYAGNLSDIPTQIYNPFSTRPDPAHPGQFIRDPFPGNIIPSNLIDKNMVGYAQATLPAAGPILNGSNNAIDTTPLQQNVQDYTFRVDETLGSRDFIWFRYSAAQQDNSSSGGRPALGSTTERPAVNYGTSWVHTFSPTLVLQAQFGHSNTQDNGITRFVAKPPDIGFAQSFAGNFIAGPTSTLIPALNVDGFFSGGESNNLNPNFGNIWEWRGNVSKIIGNHSWKFGGEWASNTFESVYNNANSTFSAQQTGNPQNSAEPGSSLASFLLNVPDNAGRRNVHETTRYGGVMSFYAQDSWKATQRLTINLGLRYDRTFQPPYGKPDTVGQNGGIETGSINFNNGTYVLQALPPSCKERGFAPCIPGDGKLPANVVVDPRGKIYHDTTTNWGPRVGLAYRIGQKTAVRSSFGIFYDNWASVTQTAQNFEGAWPDIGQQLAQNLNKPTTGAPLPTLRGQNPFAPAGVGGTGCYCNADSGMFPAPTPFQQVQWFMDPYAKNPYSMQWNFGVQHQVSEAQVLTLNYVGSGSRRLNVGGYYNVALTPGPGDPQARALYPNIGPTFYDRSIGKGSYNALQFQYERRYSKGWAYQVAYTYSKSIDIGSSGWYGVEGQSVTDPYHVQRDRGPSGFDLTNVLSVNMIYDVPVGKGRRFSTGNGVADYILGNWQANSIFVGRSGQVYNVYASGDIANTGNVGWTQYERANLVGDPNASFNKTWDHYINTAAFAVPAQYTFGTLGRNRFRSDPSWNLDFSMFRGFPFKEHYRFEFRAEAFNVLNTVIYGIPSSDMADPANFGRVTGTANHPRQLQMGAKFIF
jgi:outer membrane receptor protein involved in Fe transport